MIIEQEIFSVFLICLKLRVFLPFLCARTSVVDTILIRGLTSSFIFSFLEGALSTFLIATSQNQAYLSQAPQINFHVQEKPHAFSKYCQQYQVPVSGYKSFLLQKMENPVFHLVQS